MDTISSNSTTNYHIRSISLPNKTHPTSQRVEDDLHKYSKQSSSSSSSSICFDLLNLQKLYENTNDLLNLPLTIKAFSFKQKEKWVDELLEKSIRILDICGIAKDLVSECKENVRDLQSSVRRRKGSDSSSTIESIITKYFSCNKKMKKEAKRSLASLKQLNQEINTLALLDNHVSTVIKILQQVNSTSISVFESIFKFLSVKSSSRSWGLVVTKLLKITTVGGGENDHKMDKSNELENVDADLISLLENDKTQILQNRLLILEGSLEGLENQMEVIFRCMIRSRTTLLNALSS